MIITGIFTASVSKERSFFQWVRYEGNVQKGGSSLKRRCN
jgi:hypothetical protein